DSIADAEAPEGTAAEYAAAYDDAQKQVAEAESARDALRERLHEAEREADSLTAKAAALGSALALSGGAAEIVASGAPGVRGLVGDAVQVRAGYEAAIAAVLGPLTEGVLVDDVDAAFRLVASGGARGTVDFVIAESVLSASPASLDIPGTVSAADVVDAPVGLRGVLAAVLIADDLAAARTARTALDALSDTRTTIVAKTGEVITAHTMRAGSGEASRLELAAERDAATERLAQVRVTASELRDAREAATQSVDEARRRAKDALRMLREHDAALATHAE